MLKPTNCQKPQGLENRYQEQKREKNPRFSTKSMQKGPKSAKSQATLSLKPKQCQTFMAWVEYW